MWRHVTTSHGVAKKTLGLKFASGRPDRESTGYVHSLAYIMTILYIQCGFYFPSTLDLHFSIAKSALNTMQAKKQSCVCLFKSVPFLPKCPSEVACAYHTEALAVTLFKCFFQVMNCLNSFKVMNCIKKIIFFMSFNKAAVSPKHMANLKVLAPNWDYYE